MFAITFWLSSNSNAFEIQPHHSNGCWCDARHRYGGCIGTGLFLGSGKTISQAGPGIILIYAVTGLMLYFLMRAMGELLLHDRKYKSFVDFSEDFLGPRAAYFVGWSYWFAWIVAAIAETIAITGYVAFWLPSLPAWVSAAATIVILLLLVPFLSFAQESPAKKKAYYFYGDSCPHCKNVDEYFQANGIYDKYDITKLEFSNPFNTRLLLKFGEAYNDPSKGAVPAIAFGNKFIVGDQPIISSFVQEIDSADNANELPDPDKIAGANSIGSQQPSSAEDSAPKGNKKNYFPVVIGALIVLGIGALVYINRKKQ